MLPVCPTLKPGALANNQFLHRRNESASHPRTPRRRRPPPARFSHPRMSAAHQPPDSARAAAPPAHPTRQIDEASSDSDAHSSASEYVATRVRTRRPPPISTAVAASANSPSSALSLSPDPAPSSAGSEVGSASSRRGSAKGAIYLCPECSQAFNRKDHLTRHIRTVHQTHKPFQCTVCNKSFGRRDEARRHVTKVHQSTEDALVCNPPRPSTKKKRPTSAGGGGRAPKSAVSAGLNSAASARDDALEYEDPGSAVSEQSHVTAHQQQQGSHQSKQLLEVVSPFSGGTTSSVAGDEGSIAYEVLQQC
ncbi:hypothetical protein BDR26DRAFT_891048 [Obelidium mucronatum]|nr:hypothetical protein BDR26DRAFT_891048 [Obelidium mucronatum]